MHLREDRLWILLFLQGFLRIALAMTIPDTRLNVMFRHQQIKLAVRSIEAYNNGRLFKLSRTLDNSLIVPFMGVADNDDHSVSSTEKNTYVSPSIRAYLIYNLLTMNFTIVWDSIYNYTSHLNYQGRGMELSDLKVYDGKLLSVDDKTGIVFRMTNQIAIPWLIEADGNGIDNKTFKTEWIAVKDEELYLGGYGKEYTDPVGNYQHDKPLWIKIADRFGHSRSVYWGEEFKSLRAGLGINFPGYMIFEAVQWSNFHQKWFFLPRKVSHEPYNEELDQMRGSNYLIIVDEFFKVFKYIQIGSVQSTRGFSAFQFIPGSDDQLILAFKSQELANSMLATYVLLFSIDGQIYIDEKVPGNYKFEGLEFFDWKADWNYYQNLR